jgi:hypothetical protein
MPVGATGHPEVPQSVRKGRRSARTMAASSKETPGLAKLLAAFVALQVNRRSVAHLNLGKRSRLLRHEPHTPRAGLKFNL